MLVDLYHKKNNCELDTLGFMVLKHNITGKYFNIAVLL